MRQLQNSADRFDDSVLPFRCATVFRAESACVALLFLSKMKSFMRKTVTIL